MFLFLFIPSPSMKNLIKIGTIQKTHGLKGEISCHIQVTPDDFGDLKSIFIKDKSGQVPYFITAYHFNQGKLTLGLEDVDTVAKAKLLLNAEIWIEAKYVTEDEYIWVDQIIGYDIVDIHKGVIGKVENYYKIPNNDLIATEIQNKEVLIPANTHIVKAINNDSKTIEVELPEGLLEIYLDESTHTEEDHDAH